MIATMIPFCNQQRGRPHQARSLRWGIISADNGDSKGNNSIMHFMQMALYEAYY